LPQLTRDFIASCTPIADNIRINFDVRFAEYVEFKSAVSAATVVLPSIDSDCLLRCEIELPQIEVWEEGLKARRGVSEGCAEKTESLQRARQTLKQADEFFRRLRWLWEDIRATLLEDDMKDSTELFRYEHASTMPLILLEIEQQTSGVRKQLASYGMSDRDIDSWQSLMYPPGDNNRWPPKLTHIELSTDAGRAAHSQAFAALMDDFAIPADQETWRFVGSRVLHAVAANGFLHIVRLLIARGADATLQDSHGNTALTEALQAGHVELVRFLLSLGEASQRLLQASTTTGFTPLAMAVTECRTWGSVLNTAQFNFMACSYSPAKPLPDDEHTPAPFQIFKMLVDAGADVNACSKSSGNIVFKLLVPARKEEEEGGSWLCTVMALRYLLLESPRREQVDLKTVVCTQQGSEHLITTALRSPMPEIRRIFVRAVADNASGDPLNMLQLQPGPPKNDEYRSKASWFSRWGGRPCGAFIPRSDPPAAAAGVSTAFKMGDHVSLHSLSQRQYNGYLGRVISPCDGSGRYTIDLLTRPGSAERGDTLPSSLRVKPVNLKHVQPTSRLTCTARVLRHYDGAEIIDPEHLAPPTFAGYASDRELDEAIEAFKEARLVSIMMGTHVKLGQHSAMIQLSDADDCLKMIVKMVEEGYRQLESAESPTPFGWSRVAGLSECARAHWPLVQSLSQQALEERYQLACIERWGEGGGRQHRYAGADSAPLKLLLSRFESCENCGADGEQFFSFCLNRSVNADRVSHCSSCGRCFYFRPGFIDRCPHCNGPSSPPLLGVRAPPTWAFPTTDPLEQSFSGGQFYWQF